MAHSANNPSNAPQAANEAADERLQHELNLLRIEGRYFCFDKRKAAGQTEEIKTTETITTFEEAVEKPIRIKPDPDYGRPGVLAYKVMHALLKKLTDQGYPFPQSVTVSNKEIARMIGRKSYDGKAASEFFNAIMQLRRTYVICSFFDKERDTWRMFDFNVIHSTRADLAETKTGRRLKNATFQFPRPIVDSLNSRYLFTLNYTHLSELAPVGMAFYKHLFFHFSHLFSYQERRDICFRKDYEALCTQWLGGLKQRQYKSHIKQQFGRHFDDLTELGLIRRYDIEKNADEDGFNLTFYPGRAFFENYSRFYRGGVQLDFSFDDEENSKAPAADVVAYFHRQRLKVDSLETQQFSEKELDFARDLLDSFSTQTVQEFVDFVLDQAQKTNFDIQTFGGSRQYLGDFKAVRRKRRRKQEQTRKRRARQQANEEEEALTDRYFELRNERIKAIKTTLAESDLEPIRDSCREQLECEDIPETNPAFDFLLQQKVDAELARRADVPSLEEWKEEQAE